MAKINIAELRAVVEPTLGAPWVRGAAGPDAFDCWGICRYAGAKLFGRELGPIAEPPTDPRELAAFLLGHTERKHWRRVPKAAHGCIVEMAHHSYPWHVGTYLDIDGGSIWHAKRGVGVCLETMLALRATGWRQFYFNDWVG